MRNRTKTEKAATWGVGRGTIRGGIIEWFLFKNQFFKKLTSLHEETSPIPDMANSVMSSPKYIPLLLFMKKQWRTEPSLWGSICMKKMTQNRDRCFVGEYPCYTRPVGKKTFVWNLGLSDIWSPARHISHGARSADYSAQAKPGSLFYTAHELRTFLHF